MAYDKYGRWVPSEDITWTKNEDGSYMRGTIQQLVNAGLDWSDEGSNVFRTKAWGEMDETARLDVLQHYDTWYDNGSAGGGNYTEEERDGETVRIPNHSGYIDDNGVPKPSASAWAFDLEDANWGLDIERGQSYNSKWSAQEAFHVLTGGGFKIVTSDKSKADLVLQAHSKDNVRDHFLRSDYDFTTGKYDTAWIHRDYKMDWKHYSTDELYRATIDEMREADPSSFFSAGWDFMNAKQVRNATSVIQGWVDDIQKEADDNGYDSDWVQNQIQATFHEQIQSGRIINKRLPVDSKDKHGGAVSGPEANQQRRINLEGWNTWHKFDPVTGTSTTLHPRTGDIRDTFTHAPPAAPTRMTVTGDKTVANIDEGIYFSNTIDSEQNITDSLQQKPDDPLPPTLTIRKVNVRKPANVDPSWKMKGNLKGQAV